MFSDKTRKISDILILLYDDYLEHTKNKNENKPILNPDTPSNIHDTTSDIHDTPSNIHDTPSNINVTISYTLTVSYEKPANTSVKSQELFLEIAHKIIWQPEDK